MSCVHNGHSLLIEWSSLKQLTEETISGLWYHLRYDYVEVTLKPAEQHAFVQGEFQLESLSLQGNPESMLTDFESISSKTKKATRLPVNATEAIVMFIAPNTALHISVRYTNLLGQAVMYISEFTSTSL